MEQQNMNNQNQQQGIMQQPPSVVSTKDSLYLSDMLSWNLLALKKAHFFAEQCQDQELKMEIERCCHMHEKHYQKILSHLNTQQNQAYTGMQ